MPGLQNRRTSQRRRKEERLSTPRREATTLFYPPTAWPQTCQEVLSCLRGTGANVRSDSAHAWRSGVALTGDSAPTTSQQQKVVEASLRHP